jgi:hypothetical protein
LSSAARLSRAAGYVRSSTFAAAATAAAAVSTTHVFSFVSNCIRNGFGKGISCAYITVEEHVQTRNIVTTTGFFVLFLIISLPAPQEQTVLIPFCVPK